MSEDVKRIPLRLERDLYQKIAQYALDNEMSRTAVIRECIAAKFSEGKPAALEVDENGESKGKGKGKAARKR